MIYPGQPSNSTFHHPHHSLPSAKEPPRWSISWQAPFCLSSSLYLDLCSPEPHLVVSLSLLHHYSPHLHPGTVPSPRLVFLFSGFHVQCPSPQRNGIVYPALCAPSVHSPGHPHSGCWAYTWLINVPQAHLVPEDQGHHTTNELDYEANPKDVHKLKNNSEIHLEGQRKCFLLSGQVQ